MKKLVLLLGLVALCSASAAQADVIYDSIPGPLPGNLPSQPYQAQQTLEFGDHILFGGTARKLTTATVTMSSWALFSEYANDSRYNSDSSGFLHTLNFNIYGVNAGVTPTVGALLGSVSKNALIPWRPAADSTCPGGTAWRDSAGNCFNGFAFNVDFDFSALNLTVPNEIVFGLSFNTQSYGVSPIGSNGPYNSLNFALGSAAPGVGTDVNPDAVFWNTLTQGWLAPGGVAGVFGQDTGWRGYVPAARFSATAVPEPTTLGLLGLGLVALARRVRHRA